MKRYFLAVFLTFACAAFGPPSLGYAQEVMTAEIIELELELNRLENQYLRAVSDDYRKGIWQQMQDVRAQLVDEYEKQHRAFVGEKIRLQQQIDGIMKRGTLDPRGYELLMKMHKLNLGLESLSKVIPVLKDQSARANMLFKPALDRLRKLEPFEGRAYSALSLVSEARSTGRPVVVLDLPEGASEDLISRRMASFLAEIPPNSLLVIDSEYALLVQRALSVSRDDFSLIEVVEKVKRGQVVERAPVGSLLMTDDHFYQHVKYFYRGDAKLGGPTERMIIQILAPEDRIHLHVIAPHIGRVDDLAYYQQHGVRVSVDTSPVVESLRDNLWRHYLDVHRLNDEFPQMINLQKLTKENSLSRLFRGINLSRAASVLSVLGLVHLIYQVGQDLSSEGRRVIDLSREPEYRRGH